MFDSHCHLQDPRVSDAEAQLARARAAGVRGFLLAGVEPDGWEAEDRIARAHPDVAVSYGLHPQVVAESDPLETMAAMAALDLALRDGSRVAPVAIGEIGLDCNGDRFASIDRQRRTFRAQLALARERDLPVVLHVLRANGEALAIVSRDGLPRAGGVMHSYSGPTGMVREWIALGLHLSFAGGVTRNNARRTLEAVRIVPRERLLVETDAPDQTPTPRRPAENEPAFLVDVIAAVARARGETVDDVAAYTEANARALFRLPAPR